MVQRLQDIITWMFNNKIDRKKGEIEYKEKLAIFLQIISDLSIG